MDAFFARLHVRYDAAHFLEDLVLQETTDRANFQARYVLRRPWTGASDCPAAQGYRRCVRERQEREAQTLATDLARTPKPCQSPRSPSTILLRV